jgi:hypothetical protein
MNTIGGYFELELKGGAHFHESALRLNTAHNCFEYILLSRKYNKVYIPYYTCKQMLIPLEKTGVKYEFYNINERLELSHPISLNKEEGFLYTNYFGIQNDYCHKLHEVYGTQLIIDNVQSFFSEPIPGVDTFYSARKFFGVPDGAYLYTSKILDIKLSVDYSSERFDHLLGRIEGGAESFYSQFKDNDAKLSQEPIKKMSLLTTQLLGSIDYCDIVRKRRENFSYLHTILQKTNKINIQDKECVAMIYPYFVSNGDILKKKLIDNKVFVATYWPNVLEWVAEGSLEAEFTNKLVAIPIDQRYGVKDMNRIIKLIEND